MLASLKGVQSRTGCRRLAGQELTLAACRRPEEAERINVGTCIESSFMKELERVHSWNRCSRLAGQESTWATYRGPENGKTEERWCL
jgi:hypothetical protein